MLSGNFLLQGLYFVAVKLYDFARVYTHHVIMMVTASDFEHRMTAIKIMTNHKTCTFKLSQHTINRGKTHIIALLHQCLVDVFGAHVVLLRRFKHLQNLHAGQGDLQPSLAQFLVLIGHISPKIFSVFLLIGYYRHSFAKWKPQV
jgi:hypothetical protein